MTFKESKDILNLNLEKVNKPFTDYITQMCMITFTQLIKLKELTIKEHPKIMPSKEILDTLLIANQKLKNIYNNLI